MTFKFYKELPIHTNKGRPNKAYSLSLHFLNHFPHSHSGNVCIVFNHLSSKSKN